MLEAPWAVSRAPIARGMGVSHGQVLVRLVQVLVLRPREGITEDGGFGSIEKP
jgi:hypothetical protein